MDRYIEFNPIKFLTESRTWRGELKKKQAELDTLLGLNAVVNDGMPHATDIGDSTGAKAVKSAELKDDIARLETYIEALDKARKILSAEENEVIDIFFFKGGYMPPKIDVYGYKYDLCRSDVYKARRKALDRIARIITELYT